MLKIFINKIQGELERLRLPSQAKSELQMDKRGLPKSDPGIEASIDESVAWLMRAQDNTASNDCGVSRDYSLISGWATSYPETTGYIIPTMLAYAEWRNDVNARESARRMLDWCLDIQLEGGGFQGGKIDAEPVVPVTFNTGQILIGLAAGVTVFGNKYSSSMNTAADWLRDTLDEDGCWRKFSTPFAEPGEKAYETHVSWGLFEAARLDSSRGWGEAGLKNVDWALGKQCTNGWFDDCCLNDPEHPLTHTIGYVLRGVLEAYSFSEQEKYLDAAKLTADALVKIVDDDGYLPGRLNSDWQSYVSWACLTGSVQIAHCLFLLYQFTNSSVYRDVGYALNKYVRRSMKAVGSDEVRGGIKGAFPVDGDYGAFEYLNWSAKFFVDSNMLEMEIRKINEEK